MRRPSDGRHSEKSTASGRPRRSGASRASGDSYDNERRNRDSSRYSSSEKRASSRHASGSSSNRALPSSINIKPMHVGLIAGLAFVLICVLALLGFVLSSGSGDDSAQREAEAQTRETVDKATEAVNSIIPGADSSTGGLAGNAKDISPTTVLSIPGSKSIETILVDSDSVSAEPCSFDTSEIKSAISSIEELGDCGFVFLDMSTGHGLSYNADEEIYIASAAKAVLTLYALTNGASADEWERYNIEEAITYSDNDAYESFAYNYSGDGYYGEWLNAHDVWFDDYVFDLYPPMSCNMSKAGPKMPSGLPGCSARPKRRSSATPLARRAPPSSTRAVGSAKRGMPPLRMPASSS